MMVLTFIPPIEAFLPPIFRREKYRWGAAIVTVLFSFYFLGTDIAFIVTGTCSTLFSNSTAIANEDLVVKSFDCALHAQSVVSSVTINACLLLAVAMIFAYIKDCEELASKFLSKINDDKEKEKEEKKDEPAINV